MAQHVVDVAAVLRGLGGDADGEHILDDGHVEDAGDAVAHRAVAAGAETGVDVRLGVREVRLVGVDAQGTGLGGGAVERALRTLEGFHAVDIHHADIRLRAGLGDRDFVEIDGRAGLAMKLSVPVVMPRKVM